MADTAIFLGAGASKAEGAPLQGQLFQDYFSSALFKNSYDDMDRELATFFDLMFQIDVDHGDMTKIKFPTFEEVLGLTDLAILRKESFRNFDIENRATNSGRLRFIAQYLVFLVAKVLDDKLRGHARFHRQLVSALSNANELRNMVFVSTNYDILIDNALMEEKANGTNLDYGVEFRNFDNPVDWSRPALDRCVQLFKPHGSLNWVSNFALASCRYCQSVYAPLIVPPTF
jgi:SIR2-like domain